MVCALLLLVAVPSSADTLEGVVQRVVDGDTVIVVSGGKKYNIRIAGIDAPERRQPGGKEATTAMRELALKRRSRVEYYKRDRYGRLIGVLWIPEPRCRRAICPPVLDAGLELVRRGLAWHFKRYQREQSEDDREAYSEAEIAARETGRGLWASGDAIAPWDWRRSRRTSQ